MPCRAPTKAAQAVQHLWVTDEVLAAAFHRFARISLAHRRHGSNVPGPLEAKKRLAKRRMGMTTAGSANAPPPGEFGALFGASPGSRPDFEKGWRWQAPVPLGKQKQKKDVIGSEWLGVGSDGLPWDPGQEQESVVEERVKEFLYVPLDNAALESEDHEAEAVESKAQDLSYISFTATAEDAAFDTQAAEHAAGKVQDVVYVPFAATETDDLSTNVPTLTEKWHEESKYVSDTSALDCEDPGADAQQVQGLTYTPLDLNAVQISNADGLVTSTTSTTATVSTTLPEAIRSNIAALDAILNTTTNETEKRTKVLHWLACLRGNPEAVVRHADTETWQAVYELLAPHFSPSDLAAHFSSLLRDDFALVLLKHWVPRFVQKASQLPEQEDSILEPAIVDEGNYMKLYYRSRDAGQIDWTQIETDFRDRLRTMPSNRKNYVLNDLASLLARHKVLHTQALEEIFAMYTRTEPNTKIKNLFFDLRRRRNCGIPTAVAARLVQRFLDAGDLPFAFYVFRSTPTVPLLEFFDLPIRLIEAGGTHGEKIFEFLNRQSGSDRVPAEFRSHPRLSLKQQHIDLVHMAAYTWATSSHISPRTAYRRVWECYRFLKDRRALLTPLMSRAMVKAGITRPLTEGGRTSLTQVRYVVSMVERIEGSEVAKEVDRLVYAFWKKIVRDKWARGEMSVKRQEEPEQGRYYEGKRRLWTKKGGKVYAPHAPKPEMSETVDESVALDEEVTPDEKNSPPPEMDSAPINKCTANPEDDLVFQKFIFPEISPDVRKYEWPGYDLDDSKAEVVNALMSLAPSEEPSSTGRDATSEAEPSKQSLDTATASTELYQPFAQSSAEFYGASIHSADDERVHAQAQRLFEHGSHNTRYSSESSNHQESEADEYAEVEMLAALHRSYGDNPFTAESSNIRYHQAAKLDFRLWKPLKLDNGLATKRFKTPLRKYVDHSIGSHIERSNLLKHKHLNLTSP